MILERHLGAHQQLVRPQVLRAQVYELFDRRGCLNRLADRPLVARPRRFAQQQAAHLPGQHGGTGRTADWDLLQRDRHLLGRMPLVLAGGLTDQNVAEAIYAVRPAAVDTASGVESQPGIKDAAAMQRFVSEALAAL